MDKKVAQFEVSSPEELREALANHKRNGGERFAAVRIFGPHILTRQFQSPYSSEKDFDNSLKLEALDTISDVSSDMEVVSQIINRNDEGTVRGVFSAMSSQFIMDYLACFRNSPLINYSISATRRNP